MDGGSGDLCVGVCCVVRMRWRMWSMCCWGVGRMHRRGGSCGVCVMFCTDMSTELTMHTYH